MAAVQLTSVEDSGDDTLLERITRRLPTLRRSEAKVAKVVLDDPVTAVGYTMAGLAEAADVSEPTVMRFCASVGCEGFQAFKFQLAQTLALGLPLTHSAIHAGDTSMGLAEKIFDHTISSLDRSRRMIDADELERAVSSLYLASDILFVGFGASGIIAQDAQQKFPLFGVPCSAPVDFHQQFIAASMSGPRSVTVAISNTGYTEQTITVAREAKEAGATVIAITGQAAPLCELADIPLIVRTFEDTDVYTPATSRIAGLVLVDVLATAVALRRPPSHNESVQRMKSKLSAMRQSVESEPGSDSTGPVA